MVVHALRATHPNSCFACSGVEMCPNDNNDYEGDGWGNYED